MGEPVRYGEWTFESDFLFGVGDDGIKRKFTRAERIILAKLTEKSGVVLSRDYLLDELNGFGSDTSDRNIDFVINRLRRKIGDSARAPAYIGTQYGEGYVWIAERLHTGAQVPGAFLVIGPLTGISHIGPLSENARAFCEALRTRVDIKTAKDQRVVIDENCPPPDAFFGKKPRFSLELSFLEIDGCLDCAMALKSYGTDQIITVSRRTVFDRRTAGGLLDRTAAEAVANDVTSAIWDVLAYRVSAPPAPSDEPLPVRMHNAALLLANTESWQEGQQRLRMLTGKR